MGDKNVSIQITDSSQSSAGAPDVPDAPAEKERADPRFRWPHACVLVFSLGCLVFMLLVWRGMPLPCIFWIAFGFCGLIVGLGILPAVISECIAAIKAGR
jgi:hypothetical protein